MATVTLIPRPQPGDTEAGAEHADVTAVNRKGERSLYAGRKKVYSKLASGFYRRTKWFLLALTLGIYYLLPWLRWDRGPDMPDQAVLLDLTHERFFFFFLEIWPQEFYFVTGLLVLASLALFLVTSLAGRVWCGYFCPQTVWTDLMIAVERFWQGDRNERMRLDKAAWGVAKLYKKGATHLTWLLIGLLTGGAWVFYFADAPTLFWQLVTLQAPESAYFFIGLFTATTYLLGGIAREQVCIYMCPWPRIQGALVDKDSFLVSYREHRGEPRGSLKSAASSPAPLGDCIDCKACIAVCPVGIDIRDGSQLECIQCALCIDACNDIMRKVGRPANLIGYATVAGLETEAANAHAKPRLIRPRTVLYSALIAAVGALILYGLNMRSTLEFNVLQDRNPLYVKLTAGGVRNGYSLKISNKLTEVRTVSFRSEGLPGAQISIGANAGSGGSDVQAPKDITTEVRVFITMPEDQLARLQPEAHPFVLVVRDIVSGNEVRRATTFRRPPQ